jgi:hypothetical protein
MSHSVALGFLDIPVDLLLYILGYLDAYDLVQARKVRRRNFIFKSSTQSLRHVICFGK